MRLSSLLLHRHHSFPIHAFKSYLLPSHQLTIIKMIQKDTSPSTPFMLPTSTFIIDPEQTPGIVHAKTLTAESAATTEALLKENNEKYHIFFTLEDHMGVYLHNHIAHHDLTLWALGASPEVLRSQHHRNAKYMRDAMIVVEPLVQDLEDDEIYKRCLGKEEHFRNFEKFFLRMIERDGYQKVLQKYMVGGGDIANDMMNRIYMGKPLIILVP
jgi:hypothetical protein